MSQEVKLMDNEELSKALYEELENQWSDYEEETSQELKKILDQGIGSLSSVDIDILQTHLLGNSEELWEALSDRRPVQKDININLFEVD